MMITKSQVLYWPSNPEEQFDTTRLQLNCSSMVSSCYVFCMFMIYCHLKVIHQNYWKYNITGWFKTEEHSGITLHLKQTEGSMNCPSHLFFVLAPKHFPLFLQRLFLCWDKHNSGGVFESQGKVRYHHAWVAFFA